MSARLDEWPPDFTSPDPALARDCAEFESIIATGHNCPKCGQPIFRRVADGEGVVFFDMTGHRFEARVTQKPQ